MRSLGTLNEPKSGIFGASILSSPLGNSNFPKSGIFISGMFSGILNSGTLTSPSARLDSAPPRSDPAPLSTAFAVTSRGVVFIISSQSIPYSFEAARAASPPTIALAVAAPIAVPITRTGASPGTSFRVARTTTTHARRPRREPTSSRVVVLAHLAVDVAAVIARMGCESRVVDTEPLAVRKTASEGVAFGPSSASAASFAASRDQLASVCHTRFNGRTSGFYRS